jgi:hypothetical protein
MNQFKTKSRKQGDQNIELCLGVNQVIYYYFLVFVVLMYCD